MEYCSSLKKGDPAAFDNMDETGGHYVKWNKPYIRKMLHDLKYMGNLKKFNS
jgi:hypothetical protein